VTGTVKWWKGEKGYGVVLTPDTAPKGIWVSFSHIEGEGYHALEEGEAVEIEYEAANQDSFRFRATRVRPLSNRWTLVIPVEDGIENRAEVDRLLGEWLAERGIGMAEVDPQDIRLELFKRRDQPCPFRVWVRASAWPGMAR